MEPRYLVLCCMGRRGFFGGGPGEGEGHLAGLNRGSEEQG